MVEIRLSDACHGPYLIESLHALINLGMCLLQLFNLIWYFLLGVSSALDTLASQAYGAADRAGVISWAITAAIVMSAFGVSALPDAWHGKLQYLSMCICSPFKP